jgi:ribonuclease-3
MTGLELLTKKLGVHIEPQLLELALTHSSYAYEQGNLPNNERLEFLGDSVLGFVVSAHLHHTFSDLPEGELTKLRSAVVSAKALSLVAESIDLGQHILLGKGELQTGGREKTNILADAVEAVFGAVYVSAGFEAASELIARLVFPFLENPDQLREAADPKTTLQERIQHSKMAPLRYETSFEGPDHDRVFFSEVFSGKDLLGKGSGRSRRTAETEAAADALTRFTQPTEG